MASLIIMHSSCVAVPATSSERPLCFSGSSRALEIPGRRMSASTSSVRFPLFACQSAMFSEQVDFPSPGTEEVTTMTFFGVSSVESRMPVEAVRIDSAKSSWGASTTAVPE